MIEVCEITGKRGRVLSALERHASQGAKFAGVGALNTAVDFAVFLLLQGIGGVALAANFAAFLVANGASYVLNSGFTFRESGESAALSASRYVRFLSVHIASLAISSAFIALFASAIGPFAAKVCAAVVTLLWNYAASAVFVFRRKSDTGSAA
jgi:putative flippase GtrA